MATEDTSCLTKLTTEISANLQCPVCLQMCDLPLMSCHNGHFTCKYCLLHLPGENMKNKTCPQCRERGFIRNLPYEKIARDLLCGVELKCPYNDGITNSRTVDNICTQTYKYGELQTHLKKCKGLQQKYNCPCPRCSEHNLYSLSELIEHIMIAMGFDSDEYYIFNFLPTEAVGKLDALIANILVKIEASAFEKNLNIRLNATESECMYSTSPIINYSLNNDAYVGSNSCIIYPPYDFFNNFKKNDTLIKTVSGAAKSVTNYTFLIDTNQIYLVRSNCSLASEMVFCDGHYLNSQYMDEDDKTQSVSGILIDYNYNSAFKQVGEPSTTRATVGEPSTTRATVGEPSTTRATVGEPSSAFASRAHNPEYEPVKKKQRITFEKLKYFDSKYYDFDKYRSEMSEELLNGVKLDFGNYTSKSDALSQIRWQLIY